MRLESAHDTDGCGRFSRSSSITATSTRPPESAPCRHTARPSRESRMEKRTVRVRSAVSTWSASSMRPGKCLDASSCRTWRLVTRNRPSSRSKKKVRGGREQLAAAERRHARRGHAQRLGHWLSRIRGTLWLGLPGVCSCGPGARNACASALAVMSRAAEQSPLAAPRRW